MSLKNKRNSFNRSYDIIIFIQAAADLRYALSICEKNDDRSILLCVVNVKLVYQFIKTLPLDGCDVIYFDYIKYNIWNPLSYIKARKAFDRLYKLQFSQITVREVFFFSRFFDWFTCGVITRLIKKDSRTKVSYYNHYDDVNTLSRMKKGSISFFKNKLIAKIVSYISRANFTARFYYKSLEFKCWKYPIIELKNQKNIKVDKKYLYSITEEEKIILFFLSPAEWNFIKRESKEKIKKFLNNVKELEDVCLYLKGHPRLGEPEELKKYFDVVIPSFVPSEFIDYDNIFKVIGLGSTSLAYPLQIESKAKVNSIIKDLKYKEDGKQKYFIDFIDKITNNKIKYVSLHSLLLKD